LFFLWFILGIGLILAASGIYGRPVNNENCCHGSARVVKNLQTLAPTEDARIKNYPFRTWLNNFVLQKNQEITLRPSSTLFSKVWSHDVRRFVVVV